jgi:DNA-binding XRE family transcriptional regulator
MGGRLAKEPGKALLKNASHDPGVMLHAACMTKRAPVATIGERLRAKRLALKKSQYEVAVEAGLRPEVISRLENNKTKASLTSLHKLAPILGFSIDELTRDQSFASKPKGKK